MFTTCIHCTADLGRNEAFEVFPVGTRLAFDAARGRLWVVCRKCDRWNLSPLEERWEAVEAAEARFRDSRLRVSTDNIGLARLREGVDLIRIGAPQRPEMAAWRYGDQFGRRRRRQMLVTGTVLGSAAAILGGMAFVGVSVGSFAGFYANGGFWDGLVNGRQGKSIGKIALPDGRLVDVLRRHARMSTIEQADIPGALQIRLESVAGSHILTGDAAMRAAARLMPTVNRFGGKRAEVRDAVSLLEEAGDPMRALANLQARYGARPEQLRWERKFGVWKGGERVKKVPGALHTLPANYRLALEMALHEDSERRAMDGELADLERAWRDAETIAKIADDMFMPASMDDDMQRLRDRKT
jgi:hypothetical protein